MQHHQNSEDLLPDLKPGKRKKKSKIGWIISGAILLVLLIMNLVDFTKSSKGVPDAWVDGQWNKFTTERSIMEMELPPIKMNTWVDPYAIEAMEHMKWHESFKTIDTTSSFYISLDEKQFHPVISLLSAGELSELMIRSISTTARKIQYDSLKMGLPGASGMIYKGTYTNPDYQQLSFRRMVITRDTCIVTLTLECRQGDKNGNAVLDRIISSIRLKDI